MSILNYVPEGWTLRPIQVQILLQLEANWTEHDVFIVPAPVASGKSVIGITLTNWITAKSQTAALVTPQVLLQEQYSQDFDTVPILKGRARYSCTQSRNCDDFFKHCGHYCQNEEGKTVCSYKKATAAVKRAKRGIFNFHSYLFTYRTIFGTREKDGKPQSIPTDVLIADEGHGIFDILSEHYTLSLWKKDTPNYNKINTIGEALIVMEAKLADMRTHLQTRSWDLPLESPQYEELKGEIRRWSIIIEGVQKSPKEFFFEKKSRSTGECIMIRPINFTTLQPPVLRRARKIVIMSGTINRQLDIPKLGLGGRRIFEASTHSIIPVERRPVITIPVANMSYKHQELSLPIMAKALKQLLEKHPNEKGLIHAPYQLASKLQEYLKDPRLLWHDNSSKSEKYTEFRVSDKPLVLVASGMSEGIDLPYDAGRWQAIIKVQYPSLSDPLMQYYSTHEKAYYNWLTIRTIVQQSGRICRGPNDYGVTYILDSSFENLRKYNSYLFPKYFLEATKRKAYIA